MSLPGRYCCKSPKLPGANFPAVKKSDRRPPIDGASITLPGSPASFSSDDEVPHIFTWKSPVQPKEILIASAKRLLQQNLPTAVMVEDYSITSSARASSLSGHTLAEHFRAWGQHVIWVESLLRFRKPSPRVGPKVDLPLFGRHDHPRVGAVAFSTDRDHFGKELTVACHHRREGCWIAHWRACEQPNCKRLVFVGNLEQRTRESAGVQRVTGEALRFRHPWKSGHVRRECEDIGKVLFGDRSRNPHRNAHARGSAGGVGGILGFEPEQPISICHPHRRRGGIKSQARLQRRELRFVGRREELSNFDGKAPF